ncbi:MAG: NAD-dependent epimerase/dehydratase family protein [Candidatus Woesearchaeota archaeon]
MAKKVLITGGSGFLGINLVRFLLRKNYELTILDIVNFDYPEKNKIVFVKGDIRNKAVVDKVVKGQDIVIHTAAALPLYKKKDIFSTDITGTRILLEASKKYDIKRFIHISSTAVYGVPKKHPIFEEDKLVGVGPYGIAKIRAEQECLKLRNKGMCVPIIRPKSFIGPERLGVFALLYDWAKDAKNFPILGKGNNRYQLLDVEDLCSAIYLCMTKPKKLVNDTFNIGAEEFRTIKRDFQAVLDHAGFGKRIISFPAWPAILFLKTLEFFKISPLYAWVYETVYKDSFVSIDKAKKKIGFKPVFSNKDALIRNYVWYLENLKSFEKKSGVSHRVPWKQGFLKVLKKLF